MNPFNSYSLALLFTLGTLTATNTYYGSGTVLSGTINILPGDGVFMTQDSSLGTADITNGGDLGLYDVSLGATSTITNNFRLTVYGNANCQQAQIFNYNGFTIFGNGTAGNATIVNENLFYITEEGSAGNAHVTNNATCFIFGNGTAGNAHFINNAHLQIIDNADLGTCNIINNFGLYLNGNASGGKAHVVNHHSFYIFDNATTDNLSLTNNSGSLLDISGMIPQHVGVGSVTGAGNIFLGSKTLTLGGLQKNDTISGVIQDGGYNGGTFGSLRKIGAKTLTLQGQNIYTGDTTVSQGTLSARGTTVFSPFSHFIVEPIGTLNLNGYDQTIRELTNNGLVKLRGLQPGTNLTITGNLNHGSGTFNFLTNIAKQHGDHLTILGTSQGNYLVTVSNQGGVPQDTKKALELISTVDGNAQFSLKNGHLNVGPYSYALEKGNGSSETPIPTNWYLVNTGKINTVATSALNTVRAFPLTWFKELGTLIERMGELRLNDRCTTPCGNVWARGFGQQANCSEEGLLPKFTNRLFGVQMGADKALYLNNQNVIYTGLFGGLSAANNIFSDDSTGRVKGSFFGGGYCTWINQQGWTLDLIGKVNHAQLMNQEDTPLIPGLSLEASKRFYLPQGWSIEPQGQIAYFHMPRRQFVFQDNLNFHCEKNDVGEGRVGLLVARLINLVEKGLFEGYFRTSWIEQFSRKSDMRVADLRFDENLNGSRVALDFGLIWKFDAANQLYLTYNTSFRGPYTLPWGFNLGVRQTF